ncbi:MAG: hypothetical protein MUF73_04530 [Rhodobacteraceae bacterium]|jgi:hypothetical protein|nr:hypothetical protein [Paracoccaceae bacterium]
MATADTVVDLPGELDVSGSAAECKRILAILGNPDASRLEIEIRGDRFTQPALQILFATLREALKRNCSCRLGPNADALVAARLDAVHGEAP